MSVSTATLLKKAWTDWEKYLEPCVDEHAECRREIQRLREALEAIIVQFNEGTPSIKWLPTIRQIAIEGLKGGGRAMAECYDCKLEYGSSAWCDVVVRDEIWQQISPTGDEGGLLCFNCMVRRLAALGLENVPFKIASGPFACDLWDSPFELSKEQGA